MIVVHSNLLFYDSMMTCCGQLDVWGTFAVGQTHRAELADGRKGHWEHRDKVRVVERLHLFWYIIEPVGF